MKGVGEPGAGEPHARIDGRGLETERPGHGHWGGTADRETGRRQAPGPTVRNRHRASPRPNQPQRKIRVTLLREDGSGNAYTRPGKGNTDRFLRLSHRFWLDGWYERLDLPATAMLLVAPAREAQLRVADRARSRVVRVVGGHRRARSGYARRGRPADSHHPAEEGPLSPTGQTKINRYLLHEQWMTVRETCRSASSGPVLASSEVVPPAGFEPALTAHMKRLCQVFAAPEVGSVGVVVV